MKRQKGSKIRRTHIDKRNLVKISIKKNKKRQKGSGFFDPLIKFMRKKGFR